MVEPVQAWRDSKGAVHATMADAVKADAIIELTSLGIFNHATITQMLAFAATIVAALEPVASTETPHAPHD